MYSRIFACLRIILHMPRLAADGDGLRIHVYLFMNSTFVQNEYFGKIRRELRPEQKTKIKRRMKI
jgi:hypothetical protein